MDVVETALLDRVGDDDLIIPKKNLMKRVANQHRSKMRAQEPKYFEFEVDNVVVDLYLHFCKPNSKLLQIECQIALMWRRVTLFNGEMKQENVYTMFIRFVTIF